MTTMKEIILATSNPGKIKELSTLLAPIECIPQIFYLPSYQCTMAQLPAKIKNEISHRAHALRQLHNLIQNL